MLQSLGSQRVGPDLETEQQQLDAVWGKKCKHSMCACIQENQLGGYCFSRAKDDVGQNFIPRRKHDTASGKRINPLLC